MPRANATARRDGQIVFLRGEVQELGRQVRAITDEKRDLENKLEETQLANAIQASSLDDQQKLIATLQAENKDLNSQVHFQCNYVDASDRLMEALRAKLPEHMQDWSSLQYDELRVNEADATIIIPITVTNSVKEEGR